ncbi:S-layer homology domain-containing protein [Paenibacillus kandeliae]|uniref:S-layer homology domain-containing protein n=1 Tax=Paenibacillus kandeliae TaxID=3231269 RepID=UPI003458C49A
MTKKWTSILIASVLTFSIGTGAAMAASESLITQNLHSSAATHPVDFTTVVQSDSQPINGAQGIQLLVTKFQLSLAAFQFIKAPEVSDYYSKAKNDIWYSDALIIAAVNGLGVPRTFDPAAKLTRQQFIDYTVKAMEKQINATKLYIQPSELSDFSKAELKKTITRAEALQVIDQAMKYYQQHPELANH